MLRRYVIPAAPSTDVDAGGAPRAIRLLGENLVAFRDPSGQVGVLDEHCPHRGASLRLARNEACGLRCLYHGWKIDRSGRVFETPPEPDELHFRDRVRAIAYPELRIRRLGVDLYRPRRAPSSAHPDFEFTTLPESDRMITTVRSECNFVQALEGVYLIPRNPTICTRVKSAGQWRRGDGLQSESLLCSISTASSQDGKPRIEVQDTPVRFSLRCDSHSDATSRHEPLRSGHAFPGAVLDGRAGAGGHGLAAHLCPHRR